MNFGEKLKKARMDKGITQTELANLLEITQQGYANYENGRREPDIKTLIRLANFFDVSLDYLIGATDDPTPPNKKPLTNSQRVIKLQEILSKIELNIDEDEALETIIKFINSNKEILEKSINYSDKKNND